MKSSSTKRMKKKQASSCPSAPIVYLNMPEGLKNAGPTFCTMTKAILKDQMLRNVFAYLDDIMVISKKKTTQIDDLDKTFANMRGAQLKLNPGKFVFGLQKDKVMAFLVSMKGIEANPDKINAIMHMKPLQSRKKYRDSQTELQR
jgi:hypothetical protein